LDPVAGALAPPAKEEICGELNDITSVMVLAEDTLTNNDLVASMPMGV
jgi:hypothetical protein